jgi:multidrug efflux pump subunit AcrB
MRWGLLVVILVMLAGSMALAVLRLVPLKMLPFDNKNEFQIVLDLPERTSLEAAPAGWCRILRSTSPGCLR